MQEAKKPYEWLGPYGFYAAGALTSSIALGAVLGLLGFLLVPHRWSSGVMLFTGIVGIVLALSDSGVGGARTPTLYRQTMPSWWRTFGRCGAMFLWGADLGPIRRS